jgi:ATP/maltotriose-dependent transcriptional regulator MalT
MRLSLSLNTHLRNCHTKLATRNRAQAINRARQLGQIG